MLREDCRKNILTHEFSLNVIDHLNNTEMRGKRSWIGGNLMCLISLMESSTKYVLGVISGLLHAEPRGSKSNYVLTKGVQIMKWMKGGIRMGDGRGGLVGRL